MAILLIPDEIRKVPADSGGVYSFTLRFPTNYELGFYTEEFDTARIARNIRHKLADIDRAQHGSEYFGVIRERYTARHMARSYEVKMDDRESRSRAALFGAVVRDNLTKEELSLVAHSLRQSFLFSPPVYVGLAQRQSLRTRLQQHLNGDTQFAQRVRDGGYSWRDFNYRYIAIGQLFNDLSPEIERLVQALFKPQLSMR